MDKKGQSLIELVIALGVGIAMLGTATGALFVILRSGQLAEQNQAASSLVSSLSYNVKSLSEANWHNIYDLNKGSENHYRVATSSGQLTIQSGDESVASGITVFARYFYVENVSRDASGNIESIYNPIRDDPSTQKITFVASWTIGGAAANVTSTSYFTRWHNFIFRQTDWSGGPGQEGPITQANSMFASLVEIDFTSTPGSLIPMLPSCDGGTEQCNLVSSVFDTKVTGGAGFNTIMWQGSQLSGNVIFKIASSNNANGPWNYSTALNPAGPNVPVKIDKSQNNDKRYVRYKLIMNSNQSNSPRVDDVILNWSR